MTSLPPKLPFFLEATLDKWPLQEEGIIVSVKGADMVACRLLEMGIIEGEPIRVLGFALFGDPMEIRLRDYQLSLRLQDAKRVLVRRATEN